MSGRPHIIVITGGPCAGKSTVQEALRETFGSRLLLVPETPTILLANGYPRPGLDVRPSDQWSVSFQRAVLAVQTGMEEQYAVMAQERGAGAIVLDRALLDGAAYMPGGEAAFLQTFDLKKEEVYRRYDLVIHLESVASCRPELYDDLKASNPARYETLTQAVQRDEQLRAVWQDHPGWRRVSGADGIDQVVHGALELITPYLTNE